MKMSTPRFIDKHIIVGVTSDAGYVVYKREGSENEQLKASCGVTARLGTRNPGLKLRNIPEDDQRITHDNNCVVTGHEAGFIKLWNLNTGQFIRQLDQATGGIRCFWITRGDRCAAVPGCSHRQQLRTHKPNCEGRITCVTMTDDRKYTTIGTDMKETLVLKQYKVLHVLVGHQSPLSLPFL
ncbi:NACHT domain- and WD repeat-containing protein 1 [Branchiostoma belcheri]|nr:NACHT domain- and WD repeat-containing protein 1 [Branchiostoma belcheri]